MSAFGCLARYSLIFPCVIHSVTTSNRVSDMNAPISGRTLGCRTNFHFTTASQSLYARLDQPVGVLKDKSRELTPSRSLNFSAEGVLTTLTATTRLRSFPFHTSPYPPMRKASPVLSYSTGTFMSSGRSLWCRHVLDRIRQHLALTEIEMSRPFNA